MKSFFNIHFLLISFIAFACGISGSKEVKTSGNSVENKIDSLKYYCHKFDTLNSLVRDCLIDKTKAQKEFSRIIKSIRVQCEKSGLKKVLKEKWVFPVKGYDYTNIGGINGEGYIVGKYDYFDGNKHTGHPSQDIFIFDRDQNSIDDNTKKPVDVLSLTGGVVIATQNNWIPTEKRRGGIYIWIYDNSYDAIIYYAHNSMNCVNIGDTVFPGMKIGELGRTGLNAYKERSPTHLHISFLKVNSNLPIPEDIYKNLKTAITIKEKQ